jgi:hypothetical protein
VAGFRSVVEDVPADGAPALLIIENEFTDSGREAHPLPLPLLGPSLRSVLSGGECASRPDGVRRSAQVMSGDVSHRNRLARRQSSELRWIGHPARRGIRLESRSACVTHTHLTADPGSTDIDSVAGPAVTWLMILEQMQHVLGARESPVSQQSVVFLRQSAAATDGDQPRITLLREDRHSPSPTIHEATDHVLNARFALGSYGQRWLDRPADLETGRVSAEWFLVGGGGQEPSGAARSGARRKCR